MAARQTPTTRPLTEYRTEPDPLTIQRPALAVLSRTNCGMGSKVTEDDDVGESEEKTERTTKQETGQE